MTSLFPVDGNAQPVISVNYVLIGTMWLKNMAQYGYLPKPFLKFAIKTIFV